MDFHKHFALNPIAYLVAFLDKIHSQGMKYIVFIDPGNNVNSTYRVYQRGMADDVFIKYHGKHYLKNKAKYYQINTTVVKFNGVPI